MTLKLSEVGKNAALNAKLQQFMVASHTDENWSFFWDKGNNEARYLKFIKPGAPKEVNIDSALRGRLNDLATQKKWGDMTADMQKAREAVEDLVDMDVMPRFEVSPVYKSFVAQRAAETKLKAQLDKVKKAVKILGIQEAAVAALIPSLAEYHAAVVGSPEKAAALRKMNAAAKLSMDITKANNLIAGLKASGLI